MGDVVVGMINGLSCMQGDFGSELFDRGDTHVAKAAGTVPTLSTPVPIGIYKKYQKYGFFQNDPFRF
jgi:hypothetical protein